MDVKHAKHSDSLAGVVILAGGASRRMGTAKASLTLPSGEQLLDYHVRQASELQVPILIADNGRGFVINSDAALSERSSPVMHIADYSSNSDANNCHETMNTGGALIAIESALQTLLGLQDSHESKNQNILWLLVISCDSLIPAADLWSTLQQSVHQAIDKQVICLEDDSHLYPLLGLYRLDIEPELKAYIDSGQRRVMPFIQPRVQAVSFIKEWQYLTNFNTPENFARACTSLLNVESDVGY